MRLFRFDREVSRAIRQYGSRELYMSGLARSEQALRVDIMHIGPQGLVGGHDATANQLFAVVHGDGWVRTGIEDRTNICAGQAAFWTAGEWHESGSEQGMTVIVIEGADVDPDSLLSEIPRT